MPAATPTVGRTISVAAVRAYDGTWNVVFATRAGNCSSTNSFPFAVSGGRVSSAGGGKVTGGISRAGIVSVRISLGLSAASGSGRLVGNSGAGRWSGIISGDRCSGSWQATLSTGAVIELGRGSGDEVKARTERFLRSVRQVAAQYGRSVDSVESADLRHADAYALRLRGVTVAAEGAPAPKKK